MMPIPFDDVNLELTKPAQLDDEGYDFIPAHKGYDEKGMLAITTLWQPNKEDRDAIMAGRPLVIKVYGDIMVPIKPYTFDENGQPNY